MIVSAIIWLYYIVYAISVALRESSRVLVPENSQLEEFEEQMDLDVIPPPENPETPKSENKLTNFFISNYKPTALLIIGFFGLVIPYYLYHKSKKIEALLERRSILNRDVRMPRLVTWDW